MHSKDFERDPQIQRAAQHLQTQLLQECRKQAETIQSITGWNFLVGSYRQSQVQNAVYKCASAREWQIFRVALKGLTTKQKLYLLAIRYKDLLQQATVESGVDPRDHEGFIQIDNYIGALVRGGLLTTDYKVTNGVNQ